MDLSNKGDKLAEWENAKEELNFFKAEEKRLRLEVLEELFPNAINTTKKALVGDLEITGSFGLIYTLDLCQVELFYDELSDEEKECITYAPKFSVSKYKKLNSPGIINDLITTKPALPTLKILEL